MDVFAKCGNPGPVQDLLDAGFRAYYRVVEGAQDAVVRHEGREMVMLGSNNYLGLANHPRVKAAAARAVETHGAGSAGSRCLNGTLDLHAGVEARLARFFGRDDAIFFTSGYMTNLGVISGLAGRGDVVVADRRAHASILDGCRLSHAEVKRFRHNDPEDLDRVLASCEGKGRLVAIDGVYSMEGEIAPLPRIVEVCRKHGARIVLDDAHGLGVLGATGRGTPEHFGLEKEIDVLVGTTSKGLPGVGGFAVADAQVVHFLRYTCRPFIFSTSGPPAALAAVREALDLLEESPALRERLWRNTRRFHAALVAMGWDAGRGETPIVPVTVGTVAQTFEAWRALSDEGVWVNAVLPPAVPPSSCLLRMTIMATHTDAHLDRALDALERVGERLGLIPGARARGERVVA